MPRLTTLFYRNISCVSAQPQRRVNTCLLSVGAETAINVMSERPSLTVTVSYSPLTNPAQPAPTAPLRVPNQARLVSARWRFVQPAPAAFLANLPIKALAHLSPPGIFCFSAGVIGKKSIKQTSATSNSIFPQNPLQYPQRMCGRGEADGHDPPNNAPPHLPRPQATPTTNLPGTV